jgi:predicted transporter
MLIFSKLLLFFYLGTALICFIYARELPDTDMGLAILIFLSLYWLVRALLQVQYFGLRQANALNVKLSSGNVSNQAISYILLIIFLTGFGLFLAPVILS